MRKLFFLLVLVSGMLAAQTPNATNTQTIGKFLKLSKVPLGLETDAVLVRGSDDGIVKYVPTNVLGGKNLQEVLNGGSLATVPNVFQVSNPNGDLSSSIGFSTYSADLQNKSNLFGNYYGSFSVGNGKPTIKIQKDNNKTLVLKFRDPKSPESVVYIPSPSELVTGKTLALSVNGNYADDNGNINITSNTTLNDAIAAGNTTTLPFYNTDSIYGRSLKNGVLPNNMGTLPFKMVGSSFSDSINEYKICIFSWAANMGFHTNMSGEINKQLFFSLPTYKQDNMSYVIATTDDIKLKEYTVSTLPTGTKGDVAYVNDASSPAFLATVVGGGSSVVRVFYNGTNWIVQ